MGTFRVRETSYINDRIVEEGDIVEIDDKICVPGSNLEPVRPGTKPSRPPKPAAKEDEE
jgi:hypothetical protein